MKAAFGLVGLLVCCGIVIAVMMAGGHPADTVNRAKPIREEAERISGVDHDGMRVQDSITLEPNEANGKLNYMLVDKIVPGGPMEKYFGLKQDDAIVAVGPIEAKDS